MLEIWVTEAHISLEDGLSNYATNPEYKQMLMAMFEGLHSKPHEWPKLAATA
jgi:hypothetical protein